MICYTCWLTFCTSYPGAAPANVGGEGHSLQSNGHEFPLMSLIRVYIPPAGPRATAIIDASHLFAVVIAVPQSRL